MNVFEKDLKEMSTPDLFLPMLLAKRDELLAIIESKQKSLKRAPQGRLRIAVNRGKPQWFHVNEDSKKEIAADSTDPLHSKFSDSRACQQRNAKQPDAQQREELLRGTYIPRSNEKLARRLAQKNYDEKVLRAACMSLNAIDEFLVAYGKNSVNDVVLKMRKVRQVLLRPVMFLDEVYAARWEGVPYEGKDFWDGTAVMMTARGEQVRSKSEVIIANCLYSLNIPYRYEFPHKFGGKTFHPDFTCLNLRTRQTFIWEHFGLVEDVGYGRNMVSKKELFAKNGFLPGINLITTSETQDMPLDSGLVQMYAEKYLL